MNHLCYITHSVSSRHNSKHLFKNVVLTTTPYRGTSHGAMNNPPRNICDSRQSLRYKYGLVRFWNLPFNFGRPPGPVFLPPPFFFVKPTHHLASRICPVIGLLIKTPRIVSHAAEVFNGFSIRAHTPAVEHSLLLRRLFAASFAGSLLCRSSTRYTPSPFLLLYP